MRLQLLHRPHRADLLQRDRQDRQADDEHERDDRRPPAEAEVVVEETDDRLAGSSVKSVCDWKGHLEALSGPLFGGCGKGLRSETRVKPAVAEGIASQDPPSGQDHAAKRPQLAYCLLGIGRTGRVIAASLAERGGQKPPVEADREQRERRPRFRSGAFHVQRRRRGAPPTVSRATPLSRRPLRRAVRPGTRSGRRCPPGRSGRRRRCGRRGRSRSRAAGCRRGPRTPRASPA